jgi:hypothetical protein
VLARTEGSASLIARTLRCRGRSAARDALQQQRNAPRIGLCPILAVIAAHHSEEAEGPRKNSARPTAAVASSAAHSVHPTLLGPAAGGKTGPCESRLRVTRRRLAEFCYILKRLKLEPSGFGTNILFWPGMRMKFPVKPFRVSVVQCRGTPYEVGRAQARLFAMTPKGRAFLGNKTRFPWWFDIRAAQRMFARFAPVLWEERVGLADELGVTMERAAFRFVIGADHKIMRPLADLPRHEGPFEASRKAGAAAPAQPRIPDLVDDGVGAFLQDRLGAIPGAARTGAANPQSPRPYRLRKMRSLSASIGYKRRSGAKSCCKVAGHKQARPLQI